MRVKRFLIIFFNIHRSTVFLKATNHFAHEEKKVQLVFKPHSASAFLGKLRQAACFGKQQQISRNVPVSTLTPKPGLQTGISRSTGDRVQLSQAPVPLGKPWQSPRGVGWPQGLLGVGSEVPAALGLSPVCPGQGELGGRKSAAEN